MTEREILADYPELEPEDAPVQFSGMAPGYPGYGRLTRKCHPVWRRQRGPVTGSNRNRPE